MIHRIEIENCWDTLQTLGIKIGQKVLDWVPRVSPLALYMPEMLDTLYLRLWMHMIDWIPGFLKKHARQQAFDDAWQALPPYNGFYIPKKAYWEVTHWQGKEMSNLERCVL